MRWALLLLPVVLLAGCGGGSKQLASTTTAATTVSTPAPKPGPGAVLYQAGGWAVVLDEGHATALHLAAGTWHRDVSGAVTVSILGPRGTVAAISQAAAELSAKAPLVESGLWIDGRELLEKGGGLTPTKGTIYGAPDRALAPGKHVVVAYARTAVHATAVASSFRVR